MVGFNPRAPRGARLIPDEPIDFRLPVSIHAPRAGRDHSASVTVERRTSFNPRAPRGARPSAVLRVTVRCGFNPRAPRGARQLPHYDGQSRIQFQSTRPARGATSFCKSFCGVMQSNTQRERCYLCNCQRANPAPWSHNSCSTRWLPSARTSRGFDERLGFAHIKK